MPVQIKLKQKYLTGRKSKYKGGERSAPKKDRNKLSDVLKAKLPPQKKRTLVVEGLTGKSVMKDAS